MRSISTCPKALRPAQASCACVSASDLWVRWFSTLLRALELDSQLAELLLRNGRRRFAHQVRSFRGLREGNHVADGSLARQQHDEAIQSESDASVRRGSVFQCIEQEAEPPACLFVTEAEGVEHDVLNVATMDTNRPRAEFDSVEHDVVRLCTATSRVRGELFDIFVVD